MKRRAEVLFCLIFFLTALPVQAEAVPDPAEKAPSKEKIHWTGTKICSNFVFEYDHAGRGNATFHDQTHGRIGHNGIKFQQIFTRREFRAFLFHMGFDWNRLNFDRTSNLPIPDVLQTINALLAVDFRWSKKDMLRIQTRPGYYTDGNDIDNDDIVVPVEIAYTRVPNHSFQWAVAMSINAVRDTRVFPGGGFRWQINDDWKLKFFLPDPKVEYRARENLHTWIGADFRGNTYRVSRQFGQKYGLPQLNNAFLDYFETRVETGVSWNVRPLIEINLQTGYIVDRHFDFHNNGWETNGSGAPFVRFALTWLYQVGKDETDAGSVPDVGSGRYEWPEFFRRLFRVPKK